VFSWHLLHIRVLSSAFVDVEVGIFQVLSSLCGLIVVFHLHSCTMSFTHVDCCHSVWIVPVSDHLQVNLLYVENTYCLHAYIHSFHLTNQLIGFHGSLTHLTKDISVFLFLHFSVDCLMKYGYCLFFSAEFQNSAFCIMCCTSSSCHCLWFCCSYWHALQMIVLLSTLLWCWIGTCCWHH